MSTSPIASLNDDILLSIFDTITSQIPDWLDPPINAVNPQSRPVNVIRVTSQVCRRWRILLLTSPWIWGRLIDLNHAFRRPQGLQWMEEVARRSGSAPLWIYGDTGNPSHFPNSNSQKYFLQRLESWERVEKFCIFIYTDDKKTLDLLQMRFLSRAPMLKSFTVQFARLRETAFLSETLLPGSLERLFADYAPSLRVIRTSQIAYRLDSSWLHNIREISPFPRHLTLEDILDILQRTPAIKRIRIYKPLGIPNSSGDLWVQSPRSSISLPNLSSISLDTSLSVVTGLLKHIVPGVLSKFHMDVRELQTQGPTKPSILSVFNSNLSSYISNYLTSNPPTFLFLDVHYGSFTLRDFTPDIIEGDSQHLEVDVLLSFLEKHDWDNVVACLFDTITASSIRQESPSPGAFESITELSIRSMVIQTTLIPKLYSVLALLRHVRDIHIGEECAHIFGGLSRLGEVLFPQLYAFHLFYNKLDADGVLSTELAPFFIWRKDIGFPVGKLYLTECRILNYFALDLRNLEAVAGLEVVWKARGEEGREEIRSYICGTGEPEQQKI